MFLYDKKIIYVLIYQKKKIITEKIIKIYPHLFSRFEVIEEQTIINSHIYNISKIIILTSFIFCM